MGQVQRNSRGIRLLMGLVGLLLLSASAPVAWGQTWTETSKLTADDGAAFDEFGTSVGISGNTAIVGAWFDDDDGSGSGSAYLFDTTTGDQLFKLTASDAAASDRFGSAVGISGTIAIVGAYRDDDNGTDSGSAYLFDTTTGNQLFKLTAGDGAAFDQFGISVGISGNIAIVGDIWDDDNGTSSGSAYLFDVTTGAQIAKLTASDAASFDQFGNSVGISGTTTIVGAAGDDDGGTNSGSAYVFSAAPVPSPAALPAGLGLVGLLWLRRRMTTGGR